MAGGKVEALVQRFASHNGHQAGRRAGRDDPCRGRADQDAPRRGATAVAADPDGGPAEHHPADAVRVAIGWVDALDAAAGRDPAAAVVAAAAAAAAREHLAAGASARDAVGAAAVAAALA